MKYRYREPHEMKDSGVEWLGMIPKEWEISEVKRFIISQKQGFYPTEDYVEKGTKLLRITDISDSSFIDYSKAPKVNISEKEKEIFSLKKGDFLFARSGTIGRFGIVKKDNDSVFASYLIRLRFKNIDVIFLKYYFLSETFKNFLFSSLHGGANKNIHAENIKESFIGIPSYSYQQKTAAFLDKKTVEFDKVIKEKEKLIEKLEEAKKSLISEVVTGKKQVISNKSYVIGDDGQKQEEVSYSVINRATHEMKDSGVEWLGMIPEEWGKTQLKFISSRTIVGIAEATTHAYRDVGIPIVRATNLKKGIIQINNLLFLSEEFANGINSKKICFKDILTVRTGNAGISAIVPQELDGAHCFTMLVTTINKHNNPYYVNYFLNSDNGSTYFDIEAWGTAQKNISVPILQELVLPWLPLDRQNIIVKYLDRKSIEFDSIIQKNKKQVANIKEAKQSLISEAVTGKIEVL